MTTTAPLKTYTDKFNELFPYYIAIGMTEEQYWDKDNQLVKYYRKSAEIKAERKNQEMWLQGAYLYDAMCRVSPIFHAFAKKGTKPVPYPSEAYSITEKQAAIAKEENEKKTFNKGKQLMEGYMEHFNKKYRKE